MTVRGSLVDKEVIPCDYMTNLPLRWTNRLKLNQHGVPNGIYHFVRYGNKKVRKIKSGKEFTCACCGLDDRRQDILDRIQKAEMLDYMRGPTSGD